MPVRWTYSDEGQFSSSLFYWLKGGVDSEFCFHSERETRPKLLGVFISDPRILDFEEDAGLLDQCDLDTKKSTCLRCKRTMWEQYDNARFALFSKHLESFVGSSFLNGAIVCHRRIESLFEESDVRGAMFLHQRPIPKDQRQSASGKYTAASDLQGQHFGVYKVLVGSSWIQKGKRIRLDDTPCQYCSNPKPYFCPECNCLSIYCFDCNRSERLREEPSVTMEPFRFALDLSDWNGDDIINTFDGVCVSGRTIELLRSSGQTCFTYGPVNCDITKIESKHADRISHLSREMTKLDQVRPPFPPM